MSRTEVFEATSLRSALEAAAARAGVSPDELRYEVVHEERGFLGVVTRKIGVRVWLPEGLREAPSAPRAPRPEQRPRAERPPRPPRGRGRGAASAAAAADAAPPAPPPEPQAVIRAEERDLPDDDEAADEDLGPEATLPQVEAMVGELVGRLQLDLQPTMSEEPGRVVIDLRGDDRELLIEREGELLDALQYLVNRMARKQLGTKKRIQIESEGYRSEREDELREMAEGAAERVKRSGAPVRLPPLNPYERRIIHVALSRRAGVRSESEGEGFLKRIVIAPTTGRPAVPGRRPRR